MAEIRATLEELKNIAQELHNVNARVKELRARKKELEAKVVSYLETNDKPGLRLDNIVFLAAEKNARARKKKVDVTTDMKKVLEKHGIRENVDEVMKEIEDARKGESSTVPVLKMKAAGLFA